MEHEPQPEHYIIVEEKDGTFSAFIRYANFESKSELRFFICERGQLREALDELYRLKALCSQKALLSGKKNDTEA